MTTPEKPQTPPGQPPQGQPYQQQAPQHQPAPYQQPAAPDHPQNVANHQQLQPQDQQFQPQGQQFQPQGQQQPQDHANHNAHHEQSEQRWASEHQLDQTDHELRERFEKARAEVGKAVVGQTEAVEGIMVALLSGGHVLLEGVPGVAKTLLVRSIAGALDLDSARIQFTPDLMPGDVTGSMIYNAQTSSFEFREGPVFTNILIADEINRTPPKTQSALLEAMEERQVSVDGLTRKLDEPFLVAATQNPVEYDGTYPLPEAQLDRFLFKLILDLPQRNTEVEILTRHAAGFSAHDLSRIEPTLNRDTILEASQRAQNVYCAPEVLEYIVDLVQATRRAPSFALGVSPRGATRLLAATRSRAWLHGRAFITPDDVKALMGITFRHRVQLRPEAQMDGIGIDQVLDSIVSTVAVPR